MKNRKARYLTNPLDVDRRALISRNFMRALCPYRRICKCRRSQMQRGTTFATANDGPIIYLSGKQPSKHRCAIKQRLVIKSHQFCTLNSQSKSPFRLRVRFSLAILRAIFFQSWPTDLLHRITNNWIPFRQWSDRANSICRPYRNFLILLRKFAIVRQDDEKKE